jgi:hypothetical protein
MSESNSKSQFPEKFWRREEIEVLERELLANLKAQHPVLVALLDEISDRSYEDTVYRFYHQSMKVYEKAPYYTRKMVELAIAQFSPHRYAAVAIFRGNYSGRHRGKGVSAGA